MVTGDDAIELAYNLRSNTVGDSIGVNMRAANYAQVNPDSLSPLKETLNKIAESYSAPWFPCQ